MKAYSLPGDLLSNNSRASLEQISIIGYSSGVTSVKNRITFQQNLFNFLLEGKKSVHYADKHEQIIPNQFILLSAGKCLMSETIATHAGHYRSILFFFDNQILADFFTSYPLSLQKNLSPASEVPFLVFEKDQFLINFANSLNSLLISGQNISARMRKVKLDELLIYLSDNYPGKIQQLRNFKQERDDELLIRAAVTTNMELFNTVEELAFLCHMSLSTFKRRFAKVYGTSPNKWLLERRMEKAAHLLKKGGQKASEIYHELGYENLSSFVQSFKQVYGITPKQYQLSN